GGLAAGLVGTAEYVVGLTENPAQLTTFRTSAIVAEVILGFLTFTGSLMAAGKLQEVKWIPQRPVTYPGQNVVNIGVLALAAALGPLPFLLLCRGQDPAVKDRAFRAVRTGAKAAANGKQKGWEEETVGGAAQLLEQANLVVVIPGYGMAVAQAQHKVRELYDQLTKRGITVKFAIHPVAGRMPGHMNVLLAEANIPYTALVEMEEINPDMPQCN